MEVYTVAVHWLSRRQLQHKPTEAQQLSNSAAATTTSTNSLRTTQRRCETVTSFQSLDRRVGVGRGWGDHEGRFRKDPLRVLFCSRPSLAVPDGQGCPLFDSIHPAFPPPTTTSSILRRAPRNDSGEATVVPDMPEPCKFPSLDSCQKTFLWTSKDADLAPHPVFGLVGPSRRCREVSSGTWSRKPATFAQSLQAGSTSHSRGGGGR